MCTECRETEKRTAAELASDDEFPVLTEEQVGRVVRTYLGVRDAMREAEAAQEEHEASGLESVLGNIFGGPSIEVIESGSGVPPFMMDMISMVVGGPAIVVGLAPASDEAHSTIIVSSTGYENGEQIAQTLEVAMGTITHPLAETGGITEDGELIEGMTIRKRGE